MHRRGITSARRLLDQEGAERRRSAFDHHADAASFRVVIHRLRYSRPRFHVIMTHQRSRVIEPEDAPTTTTTGARLNGKQHSRFHDTLFLCVAIEYETVVFTTTVELPKRRIKNHLSAPIRSSSNSQRIRLFSSVAALGGGDRSNRREKRESIYLLADCESRRRGRAARECAG